MLLILPAVFEILYSLVFLLGYVSSSSYPQPLTDEEEMKYILMHKNGNCEARNILIERNLRLIAGIVNRKYYLLKNELDDLYSIGSIGLVKAIDSFDYQKGTKLSTYASKCIENEILMHLRKDSKTQNQVYLQEPIEMDKDGNEVTLMDIVASDYEMPAEKAEVSILATWLYQKVEKVLENQERNIIMLRYGLYDLSVKTQQEIADMLGISRSYVSRIEKRAVGKLMKEFKKEYCH